MKRPFQPLLRKRIADTDDDTPASLAPNGLNVDGHGIAEPDRIAFRTQPFPQDLFNPRDRSPTIALLTAAGWAGLGMVGLIATLCRNDRRFRHGCSVHRTRHATV